MRLIRLVLETGKGDLFLVTRKDIAEYAGVSKTSVTRVINNQGKVSKDTIEKVNKAIQELGYYPNMVARSLKTKKTYQILFHAPELENPFFAEIHRGMDAFAEQNGYHIVVSTRYDRAAVRQRQYDGVILSYVPEEQSEKEYAKLGFPVIATNYINRRLDIPHIDVDIESGMIKALDYLYECGHRKIALISLRLIEDQRMSGYVKWLKKVGLPFRESLVFRDLTGSSNYEQGYNAGIAWAESNRDASAIVAFNDAMAIGLIAGLAKKGIRVPEDISLIGFDDITQAKYTYPALTTVKTPLYEIGWECAQLLMKVLNNETEPTKVLKTELIIRDSVAKLVK